MVDKRLSGYSAFKPINIHLKNTLTLSEKPSKDLINHILKLS